MDENQRVRITVDAPALGAHVEMVEGTIGEILPLMLRAEDATDNDRHGFALAVMAVSLRIDGAQLTVAELQNLGARKFKALMKLAPIALEANGFGTQGDEEKKD